MEATVAIFQTPLDWYKQRTQSFCNYYWCRYFWM